MNAGALVVGEALIDEVVTGSAVDRYPGGSPANVALGLARLNMVTRLHTAIGDDADGELIRRHLAGSGVSLTRESITDQPTSRAVATVGADGSATYRFSLSWAPRDLGDLRKPMIVHTGSLAAFLEPGCDVTRDIVRRGRAVGAFISFDPNMRPSLIADPDRAREQFTALARASNLTKLSDEDVDYLFPGRSIEYVIDRLIASGVPVVGITRGSKGALLASGEHRADISATAVTVADTVGAGDSFMAALIWSLTVESGGWDGRPVTESRLVSVGTRAAHLAAITVSRTGADLPTLADLEAASPIA
ncbi:carbohydrate kinase [Leifsonia sp. fls2-241-R2A-40a]|uniref:carbohydrate kinase family protein n=1 Tax=Leifsonia sp. fls2-241-R2A-40a TaxID=3040290 RepID=UPI00254D3BE8|nr:carbohydrate kinase [Leifsonia sp. fls2-241-R2A-40a]